MAPDMKRILHNAKDNLSYGLETLRLAAAAKNPARIPLIILILASAALKVASATSAVLAFKVIWVLATGGDEITGFWHLFGAAVTAVGAWKLSRGIDSFVRQTVR